jgi:hypothetical protein
MLPVRLVVEENLQSSATKTVAVPDKDIVPFAEPDPVLDTHLSPIFNVPPERFIVLPASE